MPKESFRLEKFGRKPNLPYPQEVISQHLAALISALNIAKELGAKTYYETTHSYKYATSISGPFDIKGPYMSTRMADEIAGILKRDKNDLFFILCGHYTRACILDAYSCLLEGGIDKERIYLGVGYLSIDPRRKNGIIVEIKERIILNTDGRFLRGTEVFQKKVTLRSLKKLIKKIKGSGGEVVLCVIHS